MKDFLVKVIPFSQGIDLFRGYFMNTSENGLKLQLICPCCKTLFFFFYCFCGVLFQKVK